MTDSINPKQNLATKTIEDNDLILEVCDIYRSFNGLKAVNGVDLKVRRGQTVAIMGPNGSGKTTLLNLITGTLRPDSGKIQINAKEIAARHPEQVAARGVTRTFQNGRVFGNLSVDENIAVGLHRQLKAHRPFKKLITNPLLAWLPLLAEVFSALITFPALRRENVEIDQRVARQVERFSQRLGNRRNNLTYTLSYANRRRTEIARALISEPELLVLDEPTAGMNQSETNEMTAQLAGLKAEGQTILLVEHKLDLIMELSDWVYVMDSGQVIAEGTPLQVRNDPQVIDAYLGRRYANEGERNG